MHTSKREKPVYVYMYEISSVYIHLYVVPCKYASVYKHMNSWLMVDAQCIYKHRTCTCFIQIADKNWRALPADDDTGGMGKCLEAWFPGRCLRLGIHATHIVIKVTVASPAPLLAKMFQNMSTQVGHG